MLGEVFRGFADCPPGFCLLQLVERVQDEGRFEEAAVVAGVEATISHWSVAALWKLDSVVCSIGLIVLYRSGSTHYGFFFSVKQAQMNTFAFSLDSGCPFSRGFVEIHTRIIAFVRSVVSL